MLIKTHKIEKKCSEAGYTRDPLDLPMVEKKGQLKERNYDDIYNVRPTIR